VRARSGGGYPLESHSDVIDEAFDFYGRFLKKQIALFARTLPDSGSSLMLDAGCGDLRFSRIVARNAKATTVVSTDVSSSNLNKGLRPSAEENIAPIVCDLRFLPLCQGIVDRIVVINVFHHLSSLASMSEALIELRRICKRNGRIFVKENVSNNPLRVFLERVYRITPEAFIRWAGIEVDPYSDTSSSKLPPNYRLLHFTDGQLVTTMEAQGFQVVSKDRQELFLYFAYFIFKTLGFLRLPLKKTLRYISYSYETERSLLRHFPFGEFCLSVSLEAILMDLPNVDLGHT
jgi:ubiquinone/menaquinone biosynthesis C-methylase UbiE